jgi:hypothetical protein
VTMLARCADDGAIKPVLEESAYKRNYRAGSARCSKGLMLRIARA